MSALTRSLAPPSTGGRAAIGEYLIGPAADPVAVTFALEAKLHDPPGSGLGAKEVSRPHSRRGLVSQRTASARVHRPAPGPARGHPRHRVSPRTLVGTPRPRIGAPALVAQVAETPH